MELLGVYFLASASLALMLGSRVSALGGGEPEWLDALREFIFKTISPSPSANIGLYKSFLEAPFYGARRPREPNAAAASLLARGDVYYSTANGRWILCQEGCADCAECLLQSKPSLKWSLRREPAFNSSSHELQLTVVPQLDDSFHMRNLRRRSHVYVTLLPLPAPSSARPGLSKRSAGPRRARIAANDSPKPLTRRGKRLLRVSPRPRQVSSRCRDSGEDSRDAERLQLEDAPPPTVRGNATVAAPEGEDRLSPSSLSNSGLSRDPEGIIGHGSVAEAGAASRLASKTTKSPARSPRRNRKAAAAETRKPSKKTKRKAIESANPIEDNRPKGTAAPALAGLEIGAAAPPEELPASSKSNTRAEMEREIARSGQQRGGIRRRRF